VLGTLAPQAFADTLSYRLEPFTITVFDNAPRRFSEEQCARLKPLTDAEKRRIKAKTGLVILGDGCMGCSVSPVYDCSRKVEVSVTKRVSGFEIRRTDNSAFRIGKPRAVRLLKQVCKQGNASLFLAEDAKFSPGKPAERPDFWIEGQCQ
jgi:hypothetical protein